MKTNYIKSIITLSFTALLFFSSCLKDERYFNPTATQAYVVELPLSGLSNFSADAVTAAGPLDTVKFVVNVASVNPPTTDTKVTVGIDNSLVAPYVTANPAIAYNTLPTGSYVFNDVIITIPAGSRQSAVLSVIFDKSKLDPSQSYMLPIKIKDAGGLTISGNFGVHYYHFIGNDFAGVYKWDFTRTPAAGNFTGRTTTLSPVTPTQFEVAGGYYTANIRYEVTFTKTGSGASATYSNFQVVINPDDEKNILNLNSITISSPAAIVAPGYSPTTQYTFTQALNLFNFQYSVLGSSGSRVNNDRYYK
ncbi:MAG: DUF1735 domain-containing protein [Janthinobacterium lividum]